MNNYVYKYVLNGEIIYIGKTRDLKTRISTHGHAGDNIEKQFWEEINAAEVYYMKFPNGYMSDMAETILINKHKPKCNKAKLIDGFDRLRINMSEHDEDWIPYRLKHKPTSEPVSVNRYNDLLKKYEKLEQQYKRDEKKTEEMDLVTSRALCIVANLRKTIGSIERMRDSARADVDRYVKGSKKAEAKGKAHGLDIALDIIEGDIGNLDYKWVVGESDDLVSVDDYGIQIFREGKRVFAVI